MLRIGHVASVSLSLVSYGVWRYGMHEATLRLRHLMSFVGRNLHQVLAPWLQSILMYEETIGKGLRDTNIYDAAMLEDWYLSRLSSQATR